MEAVWGREVGAARGGYLAAIGGEGLGWAARRGGCDYEGGGGGSGAVAMAASLATGSWAGAVE